MAPWHEVDVKGDLQKSLRCMDLRTYAQTYISTNPGSMVSCALDPECGGYASNDRWLYQITLQGGWYMLQNDPVCKRIAGGPILLFADSDDMKSANRVGMDPGASTKEVDLAFVIPTAWITVTKAPNHSPKSGQAFTPDWGDVGDVCGDGKCTENKTKQKQPNPGVVQQGDSKDPATPPEPVKPGMKGNLFGKK